MMNIMKNLILPKMMSTYSLFFSDQHSRTQIYSIFNHIKKRKVANIHTRNVPASLTDIETGVCCVLFSFSALPNLEKFIFKYQLLFTSLVAETAAKTFPNAHSTFCCFFLTSSLTLT